MTEAPAETEHVETETDDGNEVEKWKSLARKQEERAKANAGAAKKVSALETELEKLRSSTQSEAEKAMTQARTEALAEGRMQALHEIGAKLVDAEFRAVLAGRLPDEQRDALLEGVDRSRFLGDDGEVDTDALTAWVDRVAPVQEIEEEAETTRVTRRPVQQLRPGAAPKATNLNDDALLDSLKAKLGLD